MTDRLSAIGGNLVIDTAPGRGTRVTAVIANPTQPGRSDPSCVVDAEGDLTLFSHPLTGLRR